MGDGGRNMGRDMGVGAIIGALWDCRGRIGL
jgi:hypothetical protein